MVTHLTLISRLGDEGDLGALQGDRQTDRRGEFVEGFADGAGFEVGGEVAAVEEFDVDEGPALGAGEVLEDADGGFVAQVDDDFGVGIAGGGCGRQRQQCGRGEWGRGIAPRGRSYGGTMWVQVDAMGAWYRARMALLRVRFGFK